MQDLGEYREMFVLNSIDEDELFSITDTDLQEMGMMNRTNRKRLLEEVRYLKGVLPSPRGEVYAALFVCFCLRDVFFRGPPPSSTPDDSRPLFLV